MGLFCQRGLGALGVGELAGVPLLLTPNRSSRGGVPCVQWVWHYTVSPAAKGTIDWLRNPASRASAHFVVDRDGAITQLVPLLEKAWHEGTIAPKDVGSADSIGVEIVNVGIVEPDGKGGWTYGRDDKKRKWRPDATPVQRTLRWPSGESLTAWWVPYTTAQISACQRLVRLVEGTAYRNATTNMVGHEDIARPVGRKSDPGPLFPWHLWPGRAPRHVTTVV